MISRDTGRGRRRSAGRCCGARAWPSTCAASEPYSSYEDFAFEVPVRDRGRLLRALPRPDGRVPPVDPDRPPDPRRPARGPDFVAARRQVGGAGARAQGRGLRARRGTARRGRAATWWPTASAKPYRMKWRGASFSNLAVLPHIIPGLTVADVVAIMGSVDPGVRRGRPMTMTATLMAVRHRGAVVLGALAGHRGLRHAARAQVRRPHAVARRAVSGRAARAAAADCRRGQAAHQGRHHPGCGGPARLQPRAGRLPRAVPADLRLHSVRAGPGRRRPEHRRPVLPGRVVDGDRGPVHGGLGLEQQVRADLGDARGQPDHLLRPAVHPCGTGPGDAGRLAEAVG